MALGPYGYYLQACWTHSQLKKIQSNFDTKENRECNLSSTIITKTNEDEETKLCSYKQ